MVSFVKKNIDELLPEYIDYTRSVRLVDTYWEDMILESSLYEIRMDEQYAGICSVHEQCELVTSFTIADNCLVCAKRIFAQMLEHLKPKGAMCVTSDELFLSLLTDYMDANPKAQIEQCAYFFDDIAQPELPERYKGLCLVQAREEHITLLRELDFFSDLTVTNETDVKYLLFDGEELLGAGHIQTMLFEPKWGAVGMVTAPKYRNQGVGRAIITMEKQICREQGLIPIAGCWYHNYASKATLEACGFASKTRYIKVIFGI